MRQKGSDIYYVRLTVPPKLRERVGKTRLIRSLGTTSHSIALSRYSAAYAALEKELAEHTSGKSFRQQVEASAEDLSFGSHDGDKDFPLSSLELTKGVVGGFDPNNPLHQHIYNYFDKGKDLPVTWDEAKQIWIELGERERSRPIAKGSLEKLNSVIKLFSPYAQPTEITFDVLDKFCSDREQTVDASTVKSNLKLLSAVQTALVTKRRLERNIVKDYPYKVGKRSRKRAYTDDEFRLVKQLHPACFWLGMTGMRSGELQNGVIEGDIMVVTELDDDEFRPKTLSSYRRVPLPPGFVRPKTHPKTWRTNLRKFIKDKNVTPHSGRHFFIQTARRAGCDMQVIAEVCGHGSDVGSSSQQGYGDFTDEVLKREAQKVWDYINTNILES